MKQIEEEEIRRIILKKLNSPSETTRLKKINEVLIYIVLVLSVALLLLINNL